MGIFTGAGARARRDCATPCPRCRKPITVVFDPMQPRAHGGSGDFVLKRWSCWNCGGVIESASIASGQGGGMGAGEPPVAHTFQITIQALDTQTSMRFLKDNIDTIVKALRRAF